MHIIAGERKGHVLAAPKGMNTRPTLGRVREALFSILGGSMDGLRVADLYAGAGTLGLEALSRGAEHCIFVEKNRAALDALRANIAKLRYAEEAVVAPVTVEAWIRSAGTTDDASSGEAAARIEAFDIVFLDPPYGSDDAIMAVEQLSRSQWVNSSSVVMVQTGARDPVPDAVGAFARNDVRKYGETALHFFSLQE